MVVTWILLPWLYDRLADRHRLGVLELTRNVPNQTPPGIFNYFVVCRSHDGCVCQRLRRSARCGHLLRHERRGCVTGCARLDTALRHVDLRGPEDRIKQEL